MSEQSISIFHWFHRWSKWQSTTVTYGVAPRNYTVQKQVRTCQVCDKKELRRYL